MTSTRRGFIGGLLALALAPRLLGMKWEEPQAPKDLSQYIAVWVKECRGEDKRWHCFLKNREHYIPTDGVLPENAFNVSFTPSCCPASVEIKA